MQLTTKQDHVNAEAVYIYREHLPANVFVMMKLGDGLSGAVCSSRSEGNVISCREGRLRFHGSLGCNASSAVLNDAQKHVVASPVCLTAQLHGVGFLRG
jgi:hypothetical protein